METWTDLDPVNLASMLTEALTKEVATLAGINTMWSTDAFPIIGPPYRRVTILPYREEHIFTSREFTVTYILRRLVTSIVDQVGNLSLTHERIHKCKPSVYIFSRLPEFSLSPSGNLRVRLERYVGVSTTPRARRDS